jgi:hypothetical protein
VGIAFVDIKNLQTLDEVLHYGHLGEVEITSREDWDHLSRLMLEAGADCYEAGVEYVRDTEVSDADYECGVEDGYREGYQDCLDKYGLEG